MDKQDKYPQKQGGGGRTFSVTLGLPTLLGSIAVLCAGFVFVFILGLLLGSGYDVESRIPPAIEQMLPARSPAQPPVVVAESEGLTAPQPKTDDKAETGPAAATPAKGEGTASVKTPPAGNNATAQEASGGVMDQGELAYRDSLKSGQAKATQQAAREKKAEADKKKTSAEKKAEADKKKAEADKKKAEAEKAQKPAGERFHYVYQAAAYKDQASADKYAAGLKQDGFKARTEKSVEKGVAWYRVVLDFTGTPDETESLRSSMRARGVPKILIRSKTPAR